MKCRFRPPPPRHEVGGLALHELVRDFPEVLPLLREFEVPLKEVGGEAVSRHIIPQEEDRWNRVVETMAWRSRVG